MATPNNTYTKARVNIRMSEIVDSGDNNNKSNFLQTFNLLTQYLKRDNSHPTHFGLVTTPGGSMNKNLFPVANNSPHQPAAAKGAQMTIFYNGQVIVRDDFAPEKAMEIVILANKLASSNLLSSDFHKQPAGLHPADLPIARKASLARFFEKRKERITARAPYQLHQGMTSSNKQEEEGGKAKSGGGQFQNQS